jgi:hypothetical protein
MNGAVSQAGRKERIERWEQLGLDQIKGMLDSGHCVVGNPPGRAA